MQYLIVLMCTGICLEGSETIESNLRKRLSQGDLPKLSFGVERPKAVEVTGGGEELLKACLENKAVWARDNILYRMAHTHAASIESCREKRSPSLHVIFRRLPDGDLKTSIHFDGHGAQTSLARSLHLSEVLYHKLTFRNNDQTQMGENLEESFSSISATPSNYPTPLSRRQQFKRFQNKTFAEFGPYRNSAISAATAMLFSSSKDWGTGPAKFGNSYMNSFVDRLVAQALLNGVAFFHPEEVRYAPSGKANIFARLKYAAVRTVLVQTPHGPNFAYANFAAAVGGGIVMAAAHPGRQGFSRPSALETIGGNFSSFAQNNITEEFMPDIKRFKDKCFKILNLKK